MIYSVSLNWLNVNFIIFTKLVTLTTLIHCTLQCTAAVSYTHLDVYKRQLQYHI